MSVSARGRGAVYLLRDVIQAFIMAWLVSRLGCPASGLRRRGAAIAGGSIAVGGGFGAQPVALGNEVVGRLLDLIGAERGLFARRRGVEHPGKQTGSRRRGAPGHKEQGRQPTGEGGEPSRTDVALNVHAGCPFDPGAKRGSAVPGLPPASPALVPLECLLIRYLTGSSQRSDQRRVRRQYVETRTPGRVQPCGRALPPHLRRLRPAPCREQRRWPCVRERAGPGVAFARY